MPQIAYLDCSSGITGAMFLGALLDAGLSLKALQQALASLHLSNYELTLSPFFDRGVRGSSFTLTFPEQTLQSLSDISVLLSASTLSQHAQETTLAVIQRLAEAEATVLGRSIEDVRIQEGILATCVGAAIGIEALDITQLYASSLPFTTGHIDTAHGLLPVPTPTTLEILRRVAAPWNPSSVESELVSPVGAALLAALARFEMPPLAIERVGYGFGQRQLPWPDCLRLCLGKEQRPPQESEKEMDTDWVTVLSSNIDNMSGELLGGLMERLFTAGALDVSYIPIQMKKNRPATMVMVICPLESGNALAQVLLRETSTLGVRIQQVQRLKAQRTQQQIDTPLGTMLVKVKRLGRRIISAAPEYEECQRISQERNLPLSQVYDVAQRSIAATLLRDREK